MQRVTEDLIRMTQYESLGELPNPFRFNDGTQVEKPEDWPKRRGEIFDLAVTMQYGTLPPAPEFLPKSRRRPSHPTRPGCIWP